MAGEVVKKKIVILDWKGVLKIFFLSFWRKVTFLKFEKNKFIWKIFFKLIKSIKYKKI